MNLLKPFVVSLLASRSERDVIFLFRTYPDAPRAVRNSPYVLRRARFYCLSSSCLWRIISSFKSFF